VLVGVSVASDFQGNIQAPILSSIAKEILALIRNDSELRKLWSINAPRACYFAFGTVTNAVSQEINEANSGNGEVFHQLMMVFDITSGPGNYRIDGPKAQALVPGGGIPIPTGGGTLVVTGHDNIRNFSIIAQGAVTMPFARYLFK